MQNEKIGKIVFWLGVFSILVHTSLSLLWAVAGIKLAYPFAVSGTYLGILALATPPLGATLMVVGGLIYGMKKKPSSENLTR